MSITVQQLSTQMGLICSGNTQMELDSVANITNATESQLSFLVSDSKFDTTDKILPCAVITSKNRSETLNAGAIIISDDPQLSFAKAVPLVVKDQLPEPGVHERAVVSSKARLGENVSIAPGAIIDDDVELSAGVIIGANTFVGSASRIDENTRIQANVAIHEKTCIGKNCRVSSGTVIGSDGFGIVPDGKQWVRFPQLGRVLIGDDVDIGANCCIDKGALDDTVIQSGVKLDNLIQIAHNVFIGENTVIAACTGIAGSARIGKNCRIGGRASIQGHISITDNVVITTCSFVNKSISTPGVYSASLSAQENSTWLKNHARLHRLDKFSRQVNQFEKKLNRLIHKGEGSDK